MRAAKRGLLPVVGSAGGVVAGDDGDGLPRVLVLAAVLGLLRGRQILVHARARVDVFKCTAILQSTNEQSQKRIVPTYNSIRLNYVHEIKMTRLF